MFGIEISGKICVICFEKCGDVWASVEYDCTKKVSEYVWWFHHCDCFIHSASMFFMCVIEAIKYGSLSERVANRAFECQQIGVGACRIVVERP